MNKEEISQTVLQAKTFFKVDERGNYFISSLFELSSGVMFKASHSNQPTEKIIYNNTSYISSDFNNLLTLIHRLDWQHGLYCNGNINDGLWSVYASLDIDHFHTQIQSILDYITIIIKELNLLPTAAFKGRSSFGKLRLWLDENNVEINDKNQKLIELIKECSWFPTYNKVRNATIHEGAHTLTFYGKESIIFQNLNGIERNIFDEHLMFREVKPDGSILINNNVVDFKRYAPLAVARIFLALEEFSKVILENLTVPKIGIGPTKSYHFGQEVFLKWCDEFINALSD